MDESEKKKGKLIQFVKEYSNLTDLELQEVNNELIRTWARMSEILEVEISELDSEQMNVDYLYWLCFTVGMFRDNQFMTDTFGGRNIRNTDSLVKKIEEYKTRYIV